MTTYRARSDIVMAILSAATRPAKQTHIMYRARLNHHQVAQYLRRLIACGLLQRDAARGVYQVTAKGQRFCRDYMACQRLDDHLAAQRATLETWRVMLRRLVNAP